MSFSALLHGYDFLVNWARNPHQIMANNYLQAAKLCYTKFIMKKGFTIVELVVIIVVLALLASISTIGYQGWRQSASRDAVQTDLQAASHAMKQYRNFNNVYIFIHCTKLIF